MTIKKDTETFLESLPILGIKTTPATLSELNSEISRLVNQGGPCVVLSANVNGLNLAFKTPWLRDFYNEAQVVRIDGAGVVLGARILGRAIPPRQTWADWAWPMARHMAAEGLSLYLLGGLKGDAPAAARALTAVNPGLRIAGTHHGYFSKQGTENEAVVDEINRCRPDILVVGMGMPMQERWILDNRSRLRVKGFMTAGNAFQFIAGLTSRCPDWMAVHGLEWLYRFWREPRRMFRRYILGNPLFIVRVMAERAGLLKR
jgi:N-acetylglucosaminyldiphosphoundecaprenol N-acetyl-beta-D-mannosaminyltransferase